MDLNKINLIKNYLWCFGLSLDPILIDAPAASKIVVYFKSD